MTLNGTVYVLGGCIANQSVSGGCSVLTSHLTAYNLGSDSWSVLPDAPRNRTRYMAAALGSQIYYVGGRDEADNIIETVDIFNTATRQWSSFVASGAARSDGVAVALGANLLAVIGGYDATYSAFASSVVLNVTNAASTALGFVGGLVPDKPTVAGDLGGLVGSDSNIYVFGGFGTDFCRPSASLERYNPATKVWTTLAPLPAGRGDMAYAYLDDTIFVMGGETKDSAACNATTNQGMKSFPVLSVDSFNTSARAPAAGWSTVAALAITRFRFSGAANPATNTIYDFGGQGAQVLPPGAPAGAAANASYYEGSVPF